MSASVSQSKLYYYKQQNNASSLKGFTLGPIVVLFIELTKTNYFNHEQKMVTKNPKTRPLYVMVLIAKLPPPSKGWGGWETKFVKIVQGWSQKNCSILYQAPPCG